MILAVLFMVLNVFIAPNDVKRYTLPFQAGQIASIDVVGSGKGDIDCYLVDRQYGEFLAKNEGPGDMCSIAVVVHETKNYQLVIWNHGEHATTFSMGANTTSKEEQ
jgi:hypothetical protein